ncbi:MAG: c-type cytochrome [Bacteroidetes bacterium]|nr:c-type cytochrome [Bacteroidota bacterium]
MKVFNKISQPLQVYTTIFSLLIIICSCGNQQTNDIIKASTDTLTEEQKHLPENALKGLTVAEGLEVKPFATEPMLKNPTNIDIDEKGRVWVTEAYNYRPAINGNPVNEAGDRIVILEDTNGDGKADTSKVFYQGPEINAPLGVCVLGNKVIVCQSPYVWIFHDDNGDDKADRKEILFKGIGGEQHDHAIHAFTFGPDGKLYFNFGNEGKLLKDKNGKPVLDQDGEEIGPKKYRQGMVFRCDTNGTHVECLGQNFRNPYEVAVDSYGTLWQSDNDDDGNRGVRINYVMEFGNYGYKDEMTGAGWWDNRTNLEDSIPYRHWHLNDPGVVPNLLQTGSGSPTGILVYEGSLLPAKFHNQIIHSDAGPNVVRSYPVQKKGAGYSADIINILKGEKDQWFRPSDVCIAPDGSLFVADWYDPGVGGHQAGDQVRGRIYRVAPNGSAYAIKREDYGSAAGAVVALQNPNLSVRYHAFTTLLSLGNGAVPELEKLWNSKSDTRMRARAFWALVKISGSDADKYIQQGLKEPDADLRITALRAARELNKNVIDDIKQLVNDPEVQVRRECILALHHNKSAEAPALWAKLAEQYDGKDRWYLEALGIGADRQWDTYLNAYIADVKDPLQNNAGRDIIWRARNEASIPYLAKLASDPSVSLKERLKYFRAFDFHTGPAKSSVLLAMIKNNSSHDMALNKLILHLLDYNTVSKSADAKAALTSVLKAMPDTAEYLELVQRYRVTEENPNLLKLALAKVKNDISGNATELLLAQKGSALVWNAINDKDTSITIKMLGALAGVGSSESIGILQTVALSDNYLTPVRKYAAAQIGRSGGGEKKVLELLKNKKVPAELIPDVVYGVRDAWETAVRKEAESYLPKSATNSNKKVPAIADIKSLTGDANAGKTIYQAKCMLCHKVGKEGNDFGPALTEIGSKYPAEGLLNAIVNPSSGISFGYEGWEIKMKDGSTLTGIIASKTESEIELKNPGGIRKRIKTSDIASKKELKQSLMTEGLYESMSNQDMANLLNYLSGLKGK